MIGKLVIAAALLLPGVAAARDVAELECLRTAATVADGATAYGAMVIGDPKAQQQVAGILVNKVAPCLDRYRWQGPVSQIAGRYFGAILIVTYLKTELAGRPGALAKLDASLASVSPERAARIAAGTGLAPEDREWLRAQASAAGVSPEGPYGMKGLAYVLASIRVAKHAAEWKTL